MLKVYLETTEERIGVYTIADIGLYDGETDDFQSLENANDFIGGEDFIGEDNSDVLEAVAQSVAEALGISPKDILIECA